LAELQQEKHSITEDKQRIENELQQKELLLQIEQKEKGSLEAMIKQMEQKMV
jgi:hypothetical protein